MIQSEVRVGRVRSQPRKPRGSERMKIGEKRAGKEALQDGASCPQGSSSRQTTGDSKGLPKAGSGRVGRGPGQSLSAYSWQEIQRHNQEADQWLVINRKVYNVTDWAPQHPGGPRVLNHCAGRTRR